jgi:hypothetical protein
VALNFLHQMAPAHHRAGPRADGKDRLSATWQMRFGEGKMALEATMVRQESLAEEEVMK